MLEYNYPGIKKNNILEKEMLDKHITKEYNFIHLGLTQVPTRTNYKLGIKYPHNYLDEKNGPFQTISRIYYKLTKNNYNFKTLRSSPKNETIHVETNITKSSIQVPKILSH
ncbi:hypothetical protein CR513_11056, partial [Mucuna pruriens]